MKIRYFFLACIGLLLYCGLPKAPQKASKSIINYTKNPNYLTLYNVRDLTGKLNDFPGAGEILLLSQEQEESEWAYITEEQLIDFIKYKIDKTVWEQRGYSIEARHGTLIVRQTKDVHQQIELLLKYLRKDMDSFPTKIKEKGFKAKRFIHSFFQKIVTEIFP